jgi:hypothetical protein
VPEPTTVALLALATGVAGLRRGLGSRGSCARALALGLLALASAHATDGVIEVNPARALVGGVLPNDARG